MPRGTHQMELNVPIRQIWDFISISSNWAPLVPGYLKHEDHHDKQSTWTLKGDIGIIKKTVKMRVDITEWKEPNTVSFLLTGLNENFKGKGSFEAESLTHTKTKMTSKLDITAKGMMGPVVNPVLKTLVPKSTRELTERIAKEIRGRERQRGY